MEIMGKEKIEVVLRQEQNNSNTIEISLRDIMETILRGKWIIAIIVIISLILTSVGYIYVTPNKGSVDMMISFNFDGIEKGLDPYGNNFDISMIKSPTVLNKVVENLGLSKYSISEDDIRTNLELTPIIPGDITEKIKSLEEAKKLNIEDIQDYTYYPNRYQITLNLPKSFSVDGEKAREILDDLFKEYQEYFFYSYSDRSVLTNALGPIDDYTKYDYPEMSDVVNNQISIIKNYLTTKNKEIGASDFRSKKTGFAFGDIIDSIGVLEKVDLQRIDSIIGAYNLTKNKDTLLKLYEHRIEQSELTSQKKTDEAKIYTDMIGKYQKDKNVLLVSGTDAGNSIETSETSKYYDELMEKSSLAGVSAQNAVHDAAFYKIQIDKLTKDTVAIAQKQAAEKEVLALLPDIKTKLQTWITVTNNTVQEFYESQLYSKAITKLSPAEYSGALSGMKKILAVGLLAGLMIGLFVAFLREYWRKSGKKKVTGEQVEA